MKNYFKILIISILFCFSNNIFAQNNLDNEIIPDYITMPDFPDYIETMPEFPEGIDSLKNFIRNNIRCPEKGYGGTWSVTVICTFTVNEDGSISDIEIIKKSPNEMPFVFEQAAIRLVNSLPKFKPAKRENRPVKSKFLIKIPIACCNV